MGLRLKNAAASTLLSIRLMARPISGLPTIYTKGTDLITVICLVGITATALFKKITIKATLLNITLSVNVQRERSYKGRRKF